MPMIMPSYRVSPGCTNIRPRSCSFQSAYATAAPSSWEISAPLRRAAMCGNGRVGGKNMAQQSGAARDRHKDALQADQAARRNPGLKTDSPLRIRGHIEQLAFAPAYFFHHAALMRVFDIDGQQFKWLVLNTVDFTHDNAGTRNRQFIAFAPHIFDQNR